MDPSPIRYTNKYRQADHHFRRGAFITAPFLGPSTLSDWGQDSSAGGTFHLDIHPSLQAGRVEKMATGCDHARPKPLGVNRRHANHTLSPCMPSLNVPRRHICVASSRHRPQGGGPEVVVPCRQEALGDEAPRAVLCLQPQYRHLHSMLLLTQRGPPAVSTTGPYQED